MNGITAPQRIAPSDKRALCFLAIAVFILQAIAWPLGPGRDTYSYFYYVFDFFNPHPADTFTIMFRTPLAPLFDVFLIEILKPFLAEILMAVLFALSMLALFSAALPWGRRFAWIFVLLLLAHQAYGSLFHVVSNDPPVAILFSFLVWSFLRAASENKARHFLLSGFLVSLILLTRPGIFSILALAPLAFRELPWSQRIGRVALISSCIIPFVLAWSYVNYLRYETFAFSIGTDVVLPLARLMAVEKTVRPENGPASEKLFQTVREHILEKDPRYKGMDLYELFDTHLNYARLMDLSDEVFGKKNYSLIKAAAREAIVAHPWPFIRDSAITIGYTFFGNLKLPVPLRNGAYVHTHKGKVAFQKNGSDQFVPLKEIDYRALGRDPKTAEIAREKGDAIYRSYLLETTIPLRDGSVSWGTFLNILAYLFPPMALWILLGGLGILAGAWAFSAVEVAVFALFSVAVLTNLAAGVAMWVHVYQYRLPFDPIYILFGLVSGLAFWKRRAKTV